MEKLVKELNPHFLCLSLDEKSREKKREKYRNAFAGS